MVAEQVAEDRDQDPEVDDEQKDLEDGEERVSEGEVCDEPACLLGLTTGPLPRF
jgi:hypothetical protein